MVGKQEAINVFAEKDFTGLGLLLLMDLWLKVRSKKRNQFFVKYTEYH